jgi:hypothetical protein
MGMGEVGGQESVAVFGRKNPYLHIPIIPISPFHRTFRQLDGGEHGEIHRLPLRLCASVVHFVGANHPKGRFMPGGSWISPMISWVFSLA